MSDEKDTNIIVSPSSDGSVVFAFDQSIVVRSSTREIASFSSPEGLGEIVDAASWPGHFALAHGSKFVSLWTLTGRTASCTARVGPFQKKVMCVEHMPGTDVVLVADAVGDVYAVPFKAPADPKVSFGHMCSIATLASVGSVTGGIVVASGDKDGKIRVSPFPATYDITSFCLGHHGTLTACALHGMPDGRVIVVSGDVSGALLAHDSATGDAVAALQFPHPVSCVAMRGQTCFVALDGEAEVIELALPSLDTVRRLGPYPGGVAGVAIGPHGILVATTQSPYVMEVADTSGATPLADVVKALGLAEGSGSRTIGTLPQAVRECKRRRGKEEEGEDET